MESRLPKKIVIRDKQWFEKFHWFNTSDGKLVISGRDATQNEILIKKYVDSVDIVLHGDVHGSPFSVIKNGKDSNDEEKKEAAIFTICHSKAWQNKRVESVYWIEPEQVSKKAPTGESIARGGFMIYGKKNYIKDVELKLGVGVQLDPFKVISGPIDNIRRKAKYYAVLIPGDKNKDKIAKEIKEFILSVAREEHKELLTKLNVEEIKEHSIEKSDIFGMVG